MATSTLTSKGQVTIPKKIRDKLGLETGDKLSFDFDENGRLTVEPSPSRPLGRLPGLLKHLALDRPVPVEEMNDAIRRRAAERHGKRSR